MEGKNNKEVEFYNQFSDSESWLILKPKKNLGVIKSEKKKSGSKRNTTRSNI